MLGIALISCVEMLVTIARALPGKRWCDLALLFFLGKVSSPVLGFIWGVAFLLRIRTQGYALARHQVTARLEYVSGVLQQLASAVRNAFHRVAFLQLRKKCIVLASGGRTACQVAGTWGRTVCARLPGFADYVQLRQTCLMLEQRCEQLQSIVERNEQWAKAQNVAQKLHEVQTVKSHEAQREELRAEVARTATLLEERTAALRMVRREYAALKERMTEECMRLCEERDQRPTHEQVADLRHTMSHLCASYRRAYEWSRG
mmetsp:Transcript_13353/g.22183  ORF Transcript_13353/g.22183 Transcript_13353/m.22183 type:complete len:260 (-) Transcript_13353:352-1131(-)|eukprot:CAMPEP_0119310462 /NCGR_PEP_ID=MMETSP1333-20130426/19582_1 /TAXON_ID=418940 /ORGANISM="Scyphosphaera apsteinii, Strain RCC1455" /LENGTH=259 /DNA_ID=CAMNT_0007314651 /DNA_START=197 /DNA_END=976 /DNA_ORIENTATION=-